MSPLNVYLAHSPPPELQRTRARKYIDMVRIQKSGAVHVDEVLHNDEHDLCFVMVPKSGGDKWAKYRLAGEIS